MKDSTRKELKRLRGWVEILARALYTHARTDLAPDAALPELRKLAKKIRKANRRER